MTNIRDARDTSMDVLAAIKTPEEQQQTAAVDEARKRLFDYNTILPRLKQLHGKWNIEINETTRRRLLRNVDLNPKQLRDSGKLKADETIVPIRLIDTNIRREIPVFVNYLISPNRQNVFKCPPEPSLDTQDLEREWTTGVRYEDWSTPHFQTVDGAQTHGWDQVEVVYDESKPLKVAIEHIGHENLFFSVDSNDLQANEIIVRRYSLSHFHLKTFVSQYGFNKAQVDMLLAKGSSAGNGDQKEEQNITVYKLFFKYIEPGAKQPIVHVAWYNTDTTSDWLKQPMKLDVGIKYPVMVTTSKPVVDLYNRPVIDQLTGQPATTTEQHVEWKPSDISIYPIFMLPYMESENGLLVARKGRVFLDQFMQEAMTAVTTGFVNGITRASNIYGSVQSDPGSTAAPKQLTTSMSNGAIYDRKIEFFRTDYPDPMVLSAVQWMATENATETGQVAFAVNNRQDSRKTAKEISLAEQQQSLLSTVNVVLYSNFLTKVYNFMWQIVRSLALQDKVIMLAKVEQSVDMATGKPTTKYINNKDLLSKDYTLRPAGDVDIVERQQMIAQMKQDWPVISQTPLASEFLKELIRRSYPQMADKWITYLDQQVNLKNLLGQITQVTNALIDPAKVAALSPQDQQQLNQLMQQTQQAMAPQTPLT